MLTRRRFAAVTLLGPDLSADTNRPKLHMLPPANWMNDPNAPVFHNGLYHLYYQHNPKAAKWDTMHWGYATSEDLIHWRHHGIALAPTPGGPDKDGCFTGCMVLDNGKPAIIYTGVRPEVQCIATSADMKNWSKHPRNPVIAEPPPGVDSPGFRDPHVWHEGGEWKMLVGAGFRGKGGTALLYRSKNLVDWTYMKPLMTGAIDPAAKGGDVARGEMWECPDFFPVGNKWLFYVSTKGTVLYWLGKWDGDSFQPDSNGVLVHGAGYAPKSCAASGGRRIIWAWLREQRSGEEQLKAGWSGAMSWAVVPSLGRDGKLRLTPAGEYEKPRRELHNMIWPDDQFEVTCRLDRKRSLSLLRGAAGIFAWDAESGRISIGRTDVRIPDSTFDLRLVVDGSVVEAFAGEREWITGRVYAQRASIRAMGKPDGIRIYSLG
jgi:beta-fructofuranosidase